MAFALHWHEYTCVHVSPILNPHHIPPHPIPLGCARAPALSALLHALNFHWSSLSQMVVYMFQCYSVKSSYPCLPHRIQKSVLYICVSSSFLLYLDCFGYSRFFVFPYKLKLFFLVLWKIPLVACIVSGNILIFTILILPIHEHGIFLHLFKSSLISLVSVL